MAGYEQTIIIGNVGRSPETKQVNDTTVCNFNVAVNSVYGSGDNRKEYTNWYSVAAWGKLGDTCSEYVTKGMQVMVVGTVEARGYTGRDGESKAELKLRAHTVKFLSQRELAQDEQQDSPGYYPGESDVPF
jgi:single-strand DNA-binding protein